MKKRNLNVLVPKDLYEAAMKKARENDLTLSQVVRQALREFIENEEQDDRPAPIDRL